MPDHALFEQTLYDISTPDHEKYGQHLNHEEIRALVNPTDEASAGILSWLQSSGVPGSEIENDSDWIYFYAPLAKAEEMMDTEFFYFTQDADKYQTKRIRTLHYSIPSSLSRHIAMIQPTTRFGQMKPERSTVSKQSISVQPTARPKFQQSPSVPSALNATACNATITPNCLRALYAVGDYQADPACGSLFGVCGYLKEYAKYDALDLFFQKYAPYAAGKQNFTYVLVNGGLDTQNDTINDDVEANLDIQYAASLVYKDNITYYSTGGLGFVLPDLDQQDLSKSENEPYLDFLNYIIKLPNSQLPQTLSTSYGEDEQSVPESYSRTVCNLFGQLGMRGVSVIFSSGDTGVGSSCQTNDGKNTTRFMPIFPAACPYVTSVGGTYQVQPEKAIYFSSGGFSDRFPRPWYQEEAVCDYLDILGDRWDGLYNRAGRGFPDVSAQAYRYHIIDENQNALELEDMLIGGTRYAFHLITRLPMLTRPYSTAAPTFAAIVSLLNNAHLSVGRRPLGFLNPWLYSKGREGLTDIIDGGSRGCTGVDLYSGLPAPFVPYASWNATIGWDPVSGLGTPNFEKLLALSTPHNKLGHIGQ